VLPQLLLSLVFAVDPGGITAARPAAPITLFARFDHNIPEDVENQLHAELDSIMAPMGFRFEWRSIESVTGHESIVELAVLTFKGQCDVSGLSNDRSDGGALGWTHVSDGNILPFSDVDCDRIRSFLQRDLLGLPQPMRAPAFGRGMARVLAHELYHIFAATAHHAATGVAQEAFTVKELLAPAFHFEGHACELLRGSRLQNLARPTDHGSQ